MDRPKDSEIVHTDPSCVQEAHGIRYLTEIGPDEIRWKSVRIFLYEIEEIGRRNRLVGHRFRDGGRQDEIVVVIILEEIEQGTDVRVPFHDLAFDPFEICRGDGESGRGGAREGSGDRCVRFRESVWVPGASCGKDIGCIGYGRHNVNLNGDGAVFGMLFPAIGEDAGFDDLLDDQWGLTPSSVGFNR